LLGLELKQKVAEAISRQDFRLADELCHQADGSLASADLSLIRGAVHAARGDTASACAALAHAHHERPERGDIAYNYGVVLQQAGRLADAVEAWTKATTAAPQNAAAWVNLALAAQQLGDVQIARSVYRDGLKHHPTQRDLLYNCANLLFRDGETGESEAHYQTLLRSHPADAGALVNYGMLLKTLGRCAEAEQCYRQAIALGDERHIALAHFNLAHVLLQRGNWRDGFAAYQWRLKLAGSLPAPWGLEPWTPALPKGSSVLLWNDQGVGDAIMFLRFAPLLAQKGYRLFALVQDELKTLAATACGIEGAFGPADEPKHFDASLPLCSLPHVLNLSAIDAGHEPYLSAPAEAATRLPTCTDRVTRVGIVWAGNPKHKNDAHRSMQLSELAPVLNMPGVEWYSLQVGDRVSELAASPYRDRICDLAPALKDFAGTASVISRLDLVISVDSAPAHLAGALAVPVWVLLPHVECDWRWQSDRSDTQWYSTMRLYRQRPVGGWSAVIGDVLNDLRAYCGTRCGDLAPL
jgi:Flp pilus assembly protein TadD